MLLAERLASTVAPAIAAYELGGMGGPQVLADFHVQRKVLHVRGLEDEIGAERDDLAQEHHIAADGVTSRGELSLLVKLPVIRQVGLGRDAQRTPAVDGDRTVEELPLETQRGADDQRRREVAAFGDEAGERGLGRVEQRVLVEEVFIGIGGNTEFWEERDRRLRVRRAAGQPQRPFQIELGIRHTDEWGADRHADEFLRVNGMKRMCHLKTLSLKFPATDVPVSRLSSPLKRRRNPDSGLGEDSQRWAGSWVKSRCSSRRFRKSAS